ncbi:MAG: hypothetical protein QOI55_1938, partial [Actinomycetota bacterium]|nr:hypothetical protein [Actinomycetota bacterium]
MERKKTPRQGGILAGPVDARERLARSYPTCDAKPGIRVVHRASGFAGDVVELVDGTLVLRGATGLTRKFRNDPGGFSVDAEPVRLIAPEADAHTATPAHLTNAR